MANYLPVLLVSVTTTAIPDDSSLSTQPRGQVDYLSHEWREEDVWRSWRNMTRQKNEIANGIRLENASWRTWWKQRNKLPTVSPETLNWLKDSDVTWLYGPLHTAVDWEPPHQIKSDPPDDKQSSSQECCGVNPATDHSSQSRSKPILKHRSISDLLTVALPNLSHTDDDAEDDLDPDEDEDEDIHLPPSRPPLLHTKSDSNVLRWSHNRNRPFRKDSPPRIIASARQPRSSEVAHTVVAPPLDERSGSSDSARETTSSSQDLSVYPAGGKKKHISFNTFVEQCIAIDSPPKPHRGSLPRETRGLCGESYDDGYDEDTENEFNDPDDVLEEGELFSEAHNGSDSDEEDVLEIRLGRSRSSSSSRSPGAPDYSHHAHSPFPYPHSRPPLLRTTSCDKDHASIAPIAPTLLKTTGVGNHFVVTDLGGRECQPPTPPVDLVYVPSFGGGYGLPRKNSDGIYGGGSSSDDVYRHKGGRFSSSPGSSTSTSASNSRSPPPAIPAAEAFPIPPVLSPPAMESPMGAHDELYDYFGSAAAAQVLSADLPVNIRQADLGADFGLVTGALGVRLGRPVDMPEVVVNDETGAIEERCESRPRSRSHSHSHSRSHSRTPSPAEANAEADTTRMRSTSPICSSPTPLPLPQDATHLSPTDSYPSRGRTPPGMPPRSWSFSNDGRSSAEPCRGRSVTRNSSFSDRERSSSRTSCVGGTGSPLGSVSPTGPRAESGTNGIYAAYMQGHHGSQRGNSSVESAGSRERGRRGGISETSTSPPRKATPCEGRSLDAAIAEVSPTPSPIPNTETSVSMTLPFVVSPGPSLSFQPPEQPNPTPRPPVPKPTLSIPIPNHSRQSTEEDKHPRHPLGASPPSVLRHVSIVVPVPPTSAPASVHAEKPQSSTLAPSARDSLTPPGSPGDHGTLVGRAAEIVSTARGLFGVLWSSTSNSPGVP